MDVTTRQSTNLQGRYWSAAADHPAAQALRYLRVQGMYRQRAV